MGIKMKPRKKRAKKPETKKMKQEREKDAEILRLQRIVDTFSRKNKVYKLPETKGNTIRLGVVSDTHIGSLYTKYDALEEFYKLLQSEGITTVLHCGDILDGHKIYRGQEFEQDAVGLEKQVDELEERYPRIKGLETHFICGNHDLSYTKQTGANVGKIIQMTRPDLKYLDDEIATVTIKTKNGLVKYRLMHPSGGTAYAISYKSQKIVEAIAGGDKPHAVFIGHYHKADHMPCFRNVQSLQAGCFQGQTPFMANKPTPAHVGAWIIEDVIGTDLSSRFKAEFVAFYEPETKGHPI